MPTEKISISVPEDDLQRFDAIRQAMGEASEYAAVPDRSSIIQRFVREFNAEHAGLLEGDTGNRIHRALTSD